MDRQIGAFEILVDPETGKGPYKLGEGTFGVTYKARHRLGHEVALKILKFDERDPKSGRFENEAKVLYSLRHPHIASFLHYDVHKGFPYCCMEFCGGGNLLDIAKERHGLPAGIVLLIGKQVCSALSYAHRRPSGAIVHRDIKPENLMLGQDEGEIVVKVIDFGLAKVFGEESEEEQGLMRSAEGFKGTSLFASPEQWWEGEIDGRSDLYSLGMTLWYLAIGTKPPIFEGKGLGGISAIHLSEDPFDLSALDSALQPVLGRLLAKDPSERFAGAEEAEAAFRDALAQRGGAGDLSLADYVRTATPSQPLVAPLLQSERSFGDSGYVVVGKWWDSSLGPVYGGKDPGGEDVALLVLEPGPQSQLSEFERHALYQRATQLQQFSAAGNLPASLIAVRGFQWFADSVSLVELDPFWAVPLLEVIRRRRKFSFPESLHLLQHIAAGVDFLKEHGLPMPDLTDSRVFLALVDPEALGKAETFIEEDLASWPRFVVKALPLGRGASGELDLSEEGLDVTATLDVSEDNAWSNELSRFAAKIYSLVGGHQIAQAAYFTPGAYTEISGLSADGNAILQSVIAATGSEYQSASCRELLLSLCRAEGVSPPQLLAEGTLVTNDVFRTSRRGPYPMPGLSTADESAGRTASFGESAPGSIAARTSPPPIGERGPVAGKRRPIPLLVPLAVVGMVLVVSLLGFGGWWMFLRHSPAALAGVSRASSAISPGLAASPPAADRDSPPGGAIPAAPSPVPAQPSSPASRPVPVPSPVPVPATIPVVQSGKPSAAKGTLVVPETCSTIQEAISKAGEGITIQIRGGLYRESLIIERSVTLEGSDSAEVVVVAPSEDVSALTVKNATGVLLKKIKFQHPGETLRAGEFPPVVRIQNSSVVLEQCVVESGAEDGLVFTGEGVSQVAGCRVAKNAARGMVVERGATVEVAGCRFERNGSSGLVVVFSGAQVRAKDSYFLNNGHSGLSVDPGGNATVEECYLNENAKAGLFLQGLGSKASITSSELGNNKIYGVLVQEGGWARIVDNEVAKNGDKGISLTDSSADCEIAGNRATDNTYDGIFFVSSGSNSVSIQKNSSSGHAYSGVYVDGPVTVSIVENTCRENRMAGIVLGNGVTGTVTKNVCNENAQYGIALEGVAASLVVSDNTTEGNGEMGEYRNE